ncbi:MAG: hypothetical protein AAFV29_26580, partial [Myxococcota bacterium]
ARPLDEIPDHQVAYRAHIELRYAVYIERAQKELERQKSLYDCEVPASIYDTRLPGMTNEVYERLKSVRPRTVGQAARIRGMTPAAVGLLAVEVERRLYPRAPSANHRSTHGAV